MQPGAVILMTAIAVCSITFVVSLPVLGIVVLRGTTRHCLRLVGWMLAIMTVTVAAAAWIGASAGRYVFVA